jgi:hypothetical protein
VPARPVRARREQGPIRVDPTTKIQLPPTVKGKKVRIRNLQTGRETVLDVGDEDFIHSDQVRTILDPAQPVLVPEFSVLENERHSVPQRVPFPGGVGFYYSRSLVFDQPYWRKLGYVTRKAGPETRIVLEPQTQTASLSADEAARRRGLQEDRGLRKLFDIGWRALGIKRYDVGLEAFRRILARRERLDAEQLSQAFLGQGIARFHQQGCAAVDEDFREADRDARNADDVSYYRALCDVEGRKDAEAEAVFRELARKQHPRYAEQSRFYLGVIAENDERFDDAESAYLDTIDFANDASLVQMAKSRLDKLKRLKADYNYDRKWFSAAAVASVGYDSNVVALPQELSPADYNLTNAASFPFLGVVFTEVKPPLGETIDNRYRFTTVALHQSNGQVAETSDIQSYDASTSLAWTFNPKHSLGFGLGYNSLYRGLLGKSGEYLASTNFDLKWTKAVGSAETPEAVMETNVKTSLVRPRQAAVDPDFNTRANSYQLSWRYLVRRVSPHVFGPGVDFEYRPSSGRENSYWSLSVVGKWDRPIGPESWSMSLGHEGVLQYTPYFQSAGKRKDWVLRYTGSVSKLWTSWLETRVQVIGNLSFSSDKSNYQYQRAQANFLLTMFY